MRFEKILRRIGEADGRQDIASDPAAMDRAMEAALEEFDRRISKGNIASVCPTDTNNPKERTRTMNRTMQIRELMNNEKQAPYAALIGEIGACLGEDTAFPEVREKVKDWNQAYGSCVPATVVYAGLLRLNNLITPLKPFVAYDSEQAGTDLEAHLMLTDGADVLVDFTPAKHGEGEFKLYSDERAQKMLDEMLADPTLPGRIAVILSKLANRNTLNVRAGFSSEAVIAAFQESVEEGRRLNISGRALEHQINTPQKFRQ